MKTIKELAEELGVSKTAIRKTATTLNVRSMFVHDGNRLLIPEPAERAIIEALRPETKTETENRKPETKNGNREPETGNHDRQTQAGNYQQEIENTALKSHFSSVHGSYETPKTANWKPETGNREPETKTETANSALIDLLRAQLEAANAQLAAKDKQIEEANNRLKEANILNAGLLQSLQAEQNKVKALTAPPEHVQPAEEPKQEEKGMLQRFIDWFKG